MDHNEINEDEVGDKGDLFDIFDMSQGEGVFTGSTETPGDTDEDPEKMYKGLLDS